MSTPLHELPPPQLPGPVSDPSRWQTFVTRLCGNAFSQTAQVRERKAKGLHPISEVHRFYILVCCFFCSTTVSITYAFDMFTEDLQGQFGLSSGDLTTVSTVGLVFAYFTLPYGFIFEACGPFLLFCICILTGGLGALLMALAFAGKVKGNTATFSVYYAFLNTCSGLIDVAYITALAELFPRNRGPVIAVVKVMTSLGSSLLACICMNIFDGDIISYIYFLMALCIVASLWGSFTVTLPPYYMNWWRRRGKTPEQIAELEALKPYYEHKFVPKPRLIIAYVIVIALIVFFAIQAPVLAYVKGVTRGGRVAVGVVAIVLTLCIFIICLPLKCLGGVNEPAPAEKPLEEDQSDGMEPARSNEFLAEDGELPQVEAPEPTTESATRQDPRYQGTLKDYLLGWDLWLVLVSTLMSGALATIVTYNSSTISIAINGYPRSKELSALYTAFLGVGSAAGRIGMGLFEAYVQHQKPGQRKVIVTMGFFVPPVIATIAGILLLTIPGKAILFPFILIYFQNGWSAAINALVFPSLFENCHNVLYSLNFLATLAKIICFNRLLFGMYTDKKQNDLGFAHGVSCTKAECVRMPLIVTTCMAFVSILVLAALHIRYVRFLRRAHAKSAAAAGTETDSGNFIDDGVPQKAVPVPADIASDAEMSPRTESQPNKAE